MLNSGNSLVLEIRIRIAMFCAFIVVGKVVDLICTLEFSAVDTYVCLFLSLTTQTQLGTHVVQYSSKVVRYCYLVPRE